MSVLSIQTRRIDGLTEATTAEDEDLLLIRKADGTGTRNIKKKNLIPKTVDKVGDLNELTTADKTSVVKAVNEIRKRGDDRAHDESTRVFNVEIKVGHLNELVGYVVQDNAESHNNIYRGKNLGRSLTNIQLQGIKDGTFKDLYVGDYFDFGTQKLCIAHLDYFYLRTGISVTTSPLSTHHLVLISDHVHGNCIYSAKKERYVYSNLKMEIDKKTIKSELGNISGIEEFPAVYLQDHGNLDNTETRRDTYHGRVGALTSCMVIGRDLSDYTRFDRFFPTDPQMALFRLSPKMIGINYSWWIADSCNDANAFFVNRVGIIENTAKTQPAGIRPFYVVTAQGAS